MTETKQVSHAAPVVLSSDVAPENRGRARRHFFLFHTRRTDIRKYTQCISFLREHVRPLSSQLEGAATVSICASQNKFLSQK